MDLDRFYPEGFVRHRRDEARIREFLIERLALEPNVQNADAAAQLALERLSASERDRFEADWIEFGWSMQ
jgi:hypothetical protein